MNHLDKQELRKLIISKRTSLDEDQRREKSKSIIGKIQTLPEFIQAKTVMIYLDFKGEVETGDLAVKILQEGKRLVVPLCHQNNLIPCLVEDPEHDIRPGTWGVPEPRKDSIRPLPPQEIDLVIVPGVAFDKQGNRLGYGKGYYDRFLTQIREGVLKVGVAFNCQIVDRIQVDKYDYRMSLLITENGVIYRG